MPPAPAGEIPPDRVLIHLNDSFSGLGSGADRHAPLCQGEIWGAYAEGDLRLSGLAAFVDYAVRWDVPVICERKPPEALLDDYAVISRLAAAVRVEP